MVLAVTLGELETAGLAVMVAIIGYLLDRRSRDIQVIVNGRYDSLVARTVQLEQAMREVGHEPPPDPAIALPPEKAKV